MSATITRRDPARELGTAPGSHSPLAFRLGSGAIIPEMDAGRPGCSYAPGMKMLLGALLAVVLTAAVFGTTYAVAQQIERRGANDAPARLASRVAADPGAVTSAPFDLATRLDDFAVVVDGRGRPIEGAVSLRGRRIDVPTGVVAAAQRHGEDAVTWQPAPGLRFAVVAVRDGDRTVIAGESLAPAEACIGDIGLLIAAAGLVTAVLAVIGVYLAGAWSAAFRRSAAQAARGGVEGPRR